MKTNDCAGQRALAKKKILYVLWFLASMAALLAITMALLGYFGVYNPWVGFALLPADLSLLACLVVWDVCCLREHDACGCVPCQNDASRIRRGMKAAAKSWSRHGPC